MYLQPVTDVRGVWVCLTLVIASVSGVMEAGWRVSQLGWRDAVLL